MSQALEGIPIEQSLSSCDDCPGFRTVILDEQKINPALVHDNHHLHHLQSQLGAPGHNDSLEEVKSYSSFYSASQEGFRTSQYELGTVQRSSSPPKLLSVGAAYENERSQMLPASSFQVSWHNVTYSTKPKFTLSSVFLRPVLAIKASLWPIFKRNNQSESNPVNGLTQSSYSVEPKAIIQDICGSFKSGELTAVIGPSGAGKTSLLNFLSLRREQGYTGQLFAQNSERRIRISSIPQNDHLPEYLTVRENLMFASRLKNPSSHDHTTNIEKVSNILGLDNCLDTRTRTISGGELKRLAIAQELLSKTDILILDEPTSGLDSLTCHKTVSVLKSITQASAKGLIEPIAIVLSIHQPQQEAFDIFDKIYVLANGGIVIYNGPPDKCTEFVERHAAGLRRPDEDYNPASFLIDIASGEHGPESIASLEKQVKLDFSNEHQQSNSRLQLDVESLSKIDDPQMAAHPKPPLYIDQRLAKGSSMKHTGSFWRTTAILSQRYWMCIFRDPKQLITRMVLHILLPIFMGCVLGTEPGAATACPRFSSEYALRDLVEHGDVIRSRVLDEVMFELENVGSLFVMAYGIVSVNVGLTTLSFAMDMQSTLKEHHNGWYSMPSYIIARFITDTPVTMLLPTVTMVIAYPLTGQAVGLGLSAGYRVLIMAMAVVLGSLVSQTIGMTFGTLYLGHVMTAMFVSQAALLPPQFLSGFMKRTKNMSPFIYKLSYLSVYRHVVELFAIARYGFNACNCIPSTISGEEVKMVGVSDRLRTFTRFWLVFTDDDTPSSDLASNNSSSSSLRTNSPADTNPDDDEDDIFQLFAKQFSLYNTHGVEVRSCNDVKPYQLRELSIDDSDLARGLVCLTVLLVLALLLLLLTVKLVMHSKTSL